MNQAQEEYSLFSKIYVPQPYKPKWFDGAVGRIFGFNRLGGPRMQVVWGPDARTFRNDNPQALKYPNPARPTVGIDRWIAEEWAPPEFFGKPEDWEKHRYITDETSKRCDLLGEYPSRGMYVMVMPISTNFGEYIPLSMEVINFFEYQLREMHKSSWNEHTALQRYRQQEERIATEMAARDAAAEAKVDELTEYFNQRGDQIEIVGTREYSKNLVNTPINNERAQKILRGH